MDVEPRRFTGIGPSRVGFLLLLTAVLFAGGCAVSRAVRTAREAKPRAISISVKGDAARLLTLTEDLTRLFDVRAEIEAVESGLTTLRLLGAYAELLRAVNWIFVQGLTVLANDEAAEIVLHAVISVMK